MDRRAFFCLTAVLSCSCLGPSRMSLDTAPDRAIEARVPPRPMRGAEYPLEPLRRLDFGPLRPRAELSVGDLALDRRFDSSEAFGARAQLTLPGAGSARPISGFAFDLGSGEAPYDEGPHALDAAPEDLGGFSDSLMQIFYGHELWLGGQVVGALGAARYQDVPFWDGLSEAEVSWITIGLRIQF